MGKPLYEEKVERSHIGEMWPGNSFCTIVNLQDRKLYTVSLLVCNDICDINLKCKILLYEVI